MEIIGANPSTSEAAVVDHRCCSSGNCDRHLSSLFLAAGVTTFHGGLFSVTTTAAIWLGSVTQVVVPSTTTTTISRHLCFFCFTIMGLSSCRLPPTVRLLLCGYMSPNVRVLVSTHVACEDVFIWPKNREDNHHGHQPWWLPPCTTAGHQWVAVCMFMLVSMCGYFRIKAL
ncbi:unnamed protein product [Lactuca saligna]|uniref:Uncharacterized protein n=1 Tax=Lactuca saligna TaxID=75948 RepID=A0AA36ED55_LACSI|nr:unnamed protein product [Lactuca saligna]